MRPKVGIVADDITGSGDIGIMFAKHGYAVRIFTAETDLERLPERLAEIRSDVVIIDTDSRLDPPDLAAAKVRRATAALQQWGAELYWKKTCSVFRGNVGAEFDALLDQLGAGHGVAVAAFPKNGRVTRDGVHYVHGRLLAESEFARDPVHPRTRSDLVVEVQSQSGRPVGLLPLETVRRGAAAVRAALAGRTGYTLCDAETQADLRTLAEALAAERVLLGSSALAEELPGVWEQPPPFDPLGGLDLGDSLGTLTVAGSVMPQSRAQVEAAADAGALVLTLDRQTVLEEDQTRLMGLSAGAATALLQGRNVVLRSENWPEAVEVTRRLAAKRGIDAVTVSRRISGMLAQAALQTLNSTGSRRLIVLGGDTSGAVCRLFGITETVVLREIAPGLPSTLMPGPHPLLLVLKSGSFGSPDFIMKATEHLRSLGG